MTAEKEMNETGRNCLNLREAWFHGSTHAPMKGSDPKRYLRPISTGISHSVWANSYLAVRLPPKTMLEQQQFKIAQWNVGVHLFFLPGSYSHKTLRINCSSVDFTICHSSQRMIFFPEQWSALEWGGTINRSAQQSSTSLL